MTSGVTGALHVGEGVTGVGSAALSKGVNFLSSFAQMNSSNSSDSPSFNVLSEMVTGYRCVLPTSCCLLVPWLPLLPLLPCSLLPC